MVVLLFFFIETVWIIALGGAIWLSTKSQNRSRFWWLIFGAGATAGVLGLFSAFEISWQPSPTLRYLGFPFPAMIWQLENGQWVDYVGTPVTAVMDVLLFVAVATLPLLAWTTVACTRQHSGVSNS
jgi:hypothetical protein